jgi:hypothetical protein
VVGVGSGDWVVLNSKKKERKERGLRKDLNETKQIYGFSSSRH